MARETGEAAESRCGWFPSQTVLAASACSVLGSLLVGGSLWWGCRRESALTPPAPSAPGAPDWKSTNDRSKDNHQSPDTSSWDLSDLPASDPSESLLPLQLDVGNVPEVPEQISRPSPPIEEAS